MGAPRARAKEPLLSVQTNLAANLVATAGRMPDKVGIRLDQIEVTWSALHQSAAKVAGQLRAAGD
jgi:long-chain acyl-CoA synthetase